MSVLSDLWKQRGLYVCCPKCSGEFSIAKANLFDATDTQLPRAAFDYLHARRRELAEGKRDLLKRKQSIDRSRIAAQAVNIGQVVEVIAPSLPGFPVVASDCRSLFKPIDYVVFRGLTEKRRVDSLLFVDVKSGRGRLSATQSQVKNLVECGKVKLVVTERPEFS